MTDEKIAHQGLLEKSSDATLLREMIGPRVRPRAGPRTSFAAQRLMTLEVDTLCGAGRGERSSA